MADSSSLIVVSVSTIPERDQLVNQIYESLTTDIGIDCRFSIAKDAVNRVKIFHNVTSGVRVLIRTYIVLVIPIIIDLAPLSNLSGLIDFHLDETINQLMGVISKLQSLQGLHTIKGNSNGTTFEQLVNSLSGANGEY